MAIKVTPVQLWSGKIEDAVGGAAKILGPLGEAKADLQFVLARRTPEDPGKGVIFVAPVKGEKADAAARQAGLAPAADVAGLRIEGDNKPGAGSALTRAIAVAGVSFRGLSASVLGKKFVCYVAFDSAADAEKAAAALKEAGKKGKK